jgi:hypothetical protein
MTRWYRPVDRLPEDKEQVLVREGDYIELAQYDKPGDCFRLKNGTTRTQRDNFIWIGVGRESGLSK